MILFTSGFSDILDQLNWTPLNVSLVSFSQDLAATVCYK